MWICACNYLLRVALYPFLCLYSNWNYSNLLDRQFCFNHKVWFHFAFHHCLVFNGNLSYYFNNNKFFCKLKNGVWGLLCNLFKGLQSVCYATALTSSPGPIKLGSDLRGGGISPARGYRLPSWVFVHIVVSVAFPLLLKASCHLTNLVELENDFAVFCHRGIISTTELNFTRPTTSLNPLSPTQRLVWRVVSEIKALWRSRRSRRTGQTNKKLSCRRQTARWFVSLNILLTHSRSLKVILNDILQKSMSSY